MWEKLTTHPFFFITEGKQGPHHHCLIIRSVKGRCELGGMRRRRKGKQGKDKKNRSGKTRARHIPESPTGAE